LEGRRFFEQNFIDAFINGLKREIKSFVQAFKPNLKTIDEALEYSLYIFNTKS
jgi:hypothetical protein